MQRDNSRWDGRGWIALCHDFEYDWNEVAGAELDNNNNKDNGKGNGSKIGVSRIKQVGNRHEKTQFGCVHT